MTTTDTELVDVHLLRLPVDVLARAQQHSDELQREFTHLASPQTDPDRVPARLLTLSQSVRGQYSGFTNPVMEKIAQAHERGDSEIDVTFRVPRSARDAAGAMAAMWEEVDEFCRSGDLLTLATPPDLARFRRWFLEQFMTQLQGQPPVPWPQYAG